MSLRLFQRGCALFMGAAIAFAHAGELAAPQADTPVHYELIGHWSKDRLNQILERDFPAFSEVPVQYTPATSGVNLYRVHYASVIPERANKRIQTSGLIAVPDALPQGRPLPILSYQHGTVYGKDEVPSDPEKSPETQLVLAQFGGQGYIVIGADYFGMGQSPEPEGYMVKGSHQQATFDMLQASGDVLARMKVETGALFLGGWSQGGFVTMAFLEKLEKEGVKVRGAATASAPLDLFAMLNGYFNYPRGIDANWINSVIILSAFSFENYYASPGLARSVLNDAYYEVSRKAYLREQINPADIPSDLHKLVRSEYFDPQFLAASPYGRMMADTNAYRWIYKTPVRNYYGEADEAITTGIGKLAMTYQQAVGSGNLQVTAISTGNTTHRGTYAVAAPEWKKWFDALTKE